MNYFIMEDLNTEKKILEAAKAIFIEKGKDGTSMQAIADKAKINKALLHYYFRSKDKLFQKVLEESMFKFLPKIETTFVSDLDFFDKIRKVVNDYICLLNENPFIPAFMMHEINRNPDELFGLLQKSGVRIDIVMQKITEQVSNGSIKPISPQSLFVNILSLCIFPLAGRPLMQRALFMHDKDAFDQFLENRKIEVAEFIINAIKIDQ